MKIKHISANMTELTMSNGCQVLFSYQTPVASWESGQFYKTDRYWSKTTSKHVNKWTHCAIVNPQDYFDNITKGI